MGAPHFRRAVPELRKRSRISVVFNMNRQVQLAVKNSAYRDITPAKVRRPDKASVNAIDQTWNANAHAGETRALEARLHLGSNLVPKFGEKSGRIGFRPHRPLIQDPAVKIADPVHSLVNSKTDPDHVGLLGVNLQVSCWAPSPRRRRFALIHDGGPKQAAYDHRDSARAQ